MLSNDLGFCAGSINNFILFFVGINNTCKNNTMSKRRGNKDLENMNKLNQNVFIILFDMNYDS